MKLASIGPMTTAPATDEPDMDEELKPAEDGQSTFATPPVAEGHSSEDATSEESETEFVQFVDFLKKTKKEQKEKEKSQKAPKTRLAVAHAAYSKAEKMEMPSAYRGTNLDKAS